MGSTTNHWKLGLFVVSGLLTAFGSLIWLGSQHFDRETRRVVTFFDESVQGLEVGSPVKFRGVTIGNVSEIVVAPDKRHVEVAVEIYLDQLDRLRLRTSDRERDPSQPFVPPEVRVQLASSGITGTKFLLVDFFDPAEHPPPRLQFPTPWAYVPAASSTLKSLEDSITQTLNRLPALGDKVGGLIDRIDSVLQEVDAGGLSQRSQRLLETADTKLQELDAEQLSTRMNAVLEEAEATLASLRSLIDKVDAEEGPVLQLVEHMNDVAVHLDKAITEAQAAETTESLRQTSNAFGDVAREAGGLTEELRHTLASLKEAANSVRDLAELLEQDPASLLRGTSPQEPPEVDR